MLIKTKLEVEIISDSLSIIDKEYFKNKIIQMFKVEKFDKFDKLNKTEDAILKIIRDFSEVNKSKIVEEIKKLPNKSKLYIDRKNILKIISIMESKNLIIIVKGYGNNKFIREPSLL